MIKIDVFFLPGCVRCGAGLGALKEIAASFGPGVFAWEERNLLQNIDCAVQLGVLASPAMAIDGKLAFISLPTPQQLQSELMKYVRA